MNAVERSRQIRKLTLKCIGSIGVGHIGGSLSIVDFLSVLYSKHLKFDAKNPKMENRDRLVMSKGHAGPGLYATLSSFGFFDEKELETLNKFGTKLPSHCDMNLTPGVDMTAGSLGQGTSAAVGMALGNKIKNNDNRVYVVVGDGECQEGQVWEAAMFAAHKRLDNLTFVIDDNKMQIDGTTDKVCNIGSIEAKFRAFNFNTISVDGHDHEQIDNALTKAASYKGAPTVIILNTVKGKGVSYSESAGVGCHNMPLTAQQLEKSLAELEGSDNGNA